MAGMPTTIKLHCPECGRALRIPLYRCATFIAVRKCDCSARWTVKAEVRISGEQMAVHEITWTRMQS